MSRYAIVRAVQTLWACPSEWDAWTDTGQYLYLRYRGGHGTVEEQDTPDWQTWEMKEPEISFRYGDALAGVIDLESFAREAGITLALASQSA